MLRQILSVSLVMTACVTLIPTKANAATLTFDFEPELPPVNEVPPPPYVPSYPEDDDEPIIFPPIPDRPPYSPPDSPPYPPELPPLTNYPPIIYPPNHEPDLPPGDYPYPPDKPPVSPDNPLIPPLIPPQPQPSPPNAIVPEPLTIFGTATALGWGVLLKRKSFKKKKS